MPFLRAARGTGCADGERWVNTQLDFKFLAPIFT